MTAKTAAATEEERLVSYADSEAIHEVRVLQRAIPNPRYGFSEIPAGTRFGHSYWDSVSIWETKEHRRYRRKHHCGRLAVRESGIDRYLGIICEGQDLYWAIMAHSWVALDEKD